MKKRHPRVRLAKFRVNEKSLSYKSDFKVLQKVIMIEKRCHPTPSTLQLDKITLSFVHYESRNRQGFLEC